MREAYAVLQKAALAAHVVTLPQSADPDSFLREHGAESLRARIVSAPTIIEHLIDDAAQEVDPNPHAKADAIAKLGPILAKVESPIERGLYVERVARKFGIADAGLVRRELRRGLGRRGEPHAPRRDAVQQDIAPPVSELQSKLISLLIDHPTLMREEDVRKMPKLLTSPDLRAIFDSILRMVDRQGSLDVTALLEELNDNQLRPWLEAKLAVQEHSLEEARQILDEGLPLLERKNIEQELPRLQQRIVNSMDHFCICICKLISMNAHFSRQLLARWIDKGVPGHNEPNAAQSKLTIKIREFFCGTTVLFTHSFPGGGPYHAITQSHSVDGGFLKQGFHTHLQ